MKLVSNEVLMAKLFRWRTSVTYNGVTLYLRVVSDATVEDARRAALLAARKLRKELRDQASDEYLLHLDAYDEYTRDELSAVIQIAASREIMREYLNTNPRPRLDPLPDHPSQEQLEEFEAAKADRDEAYITAMQEHVEAWRVEFEQRLATMTDEQLRAGAKRYRTDELCETLFNSVFETYVVAASVYVDERYAKRAFTVEEYKQLPTEVQRTLYDAYNTMNIATDDVKNS